jgi:hypothetical protein
LGWSFLYTPKESFRPNQQLLFVGLNPAGNAYSEDYECEEGNAYLCDDWGSGAGKAPLQQQIQMLYRAIADESDGHVAFEVLMERTLAANYVPFRSRNWPSLRDPEGSLSFSRSLWSRISDVVQARVVIAMGTVPYRELLSLLKSKAWALASGDEGNARLEWGRQTYSLAKLQNGGKAMLLVRLPHLSRYRLFSRPQCRPALTLIAREVAVALNACSL